MCKQVLEQDAKDRRERQRVDHEQQNSVLDNLVLGNQQPMAPQNGVPAPSALKEPEMKASSSLMTGAALNAQANFTGKTLLSQPKTANNNEAGGTSDLRYSETPQWENDMPSFGSQVKTPLMS